MKSSIPFLITRLVFSLMVIPMSWGQGFNDIMVEGTGLPRDDQAFEMIGLGKHLLEQKAYAEAVRAFEAAAQRELHQGTTAAIYLSGLAYYYQGDDYMATQRFDQIISSYALSRYLDDAIYHKALLFAQNYDLSKQEQGIADLFFLIDNSPRMDILQDARSTARSFLFYYVNPLVVERYYAKAPYRHLPLVLEAMCYRKLEAGQKHAAQELFNNFVAQGGQPSPFLLRLFDERHVMHYYEPNVTKIGMMLPLFLQETLPQGMDEIPPKSKIALEFYEGFQKAVADYEPYARKKIFLKIFDTARDSFTISQHLYELDRFYPDVVIGEVYNSASKVISDWSERRGVPQVVPFSPTMPIHDKSFLFLAHSGVATHGLRMGEFARHQMKLNKVAVWTDGRRVTEQLVEAFMATFDTLGGEVIRVPIDSTFALAKNQILEYTRSLRLQGIDGHYIPLASEESSGLILSELQFLREEVRIMGSPSWQYFNAIDRSTKERYGVVFSTSYLRQNDSAQYKAFYSDFFRHYHLPPSEYHVQGYDMGMYILQLLDRYDYREGIPLTTYIRGYGIHRGIHQDYYFAHHPDNQMLHICQFRGGGIFKINRY